MLYKDETRVGWMKDTDGQLASMRYKGWDARGSVHFYQLCAFQHVNFQ